MGENTMIFENKEQEEAKFLLEKLIWKHIPSHQSSIAIRLLRTLLARSKNEGAMEYMNKIKNRMEVQNELSGK